jgi:hypothetical protein
MFDSMEGVMPEEIPTPPAAAVAAVAAVSVSNAVTDIWEPPVSSQVPKPTPEGEDFMFESIDRHR